MSEQPKTTEASKDTELSNAINETTNLVTIDPKPITEIIRDFIGNKKFSAKLSSGQIQTLNTLLQHFPHIFEDINVDIQKIIADKVLDFSDMPHFVMIAKTVTNTKIKELKAIKITKKDVADMIEALIIILIEMDIVSTGQSKDTYIELLKASMQLLDASIDLDDTVRMSCSCCW